MKWSLITHYHINRYACIIIVCTISAVDTQTPVLWLDVGEHMTFGSWCVSLLGDSRLCTGPLRSVKTCPKEHLINMILHVIDEFVIKNRENGVTRRHGLCGLDGVLIPFRIAAVAFLRSLASCLFFNIASLFSAYLSLSLCLFSSFGFVF